MWRSRTFTWSLALLLAGVLALQSDTAFSAPAGADDPALEGLGDDLLDEALLRDLINNSPDGNSQHPDSPVTPDAENLRRLLSPEANPAVPDGEDLGQQQESPLERISRRMATASNLIESRTTNGETRTVQEEIVTELDRLIEQLNKQCQNCSGGQCNKPGKQQTQSSTPKPGSQQSGQPQQGEGNQSQPAQSQLNQSGSGDSQPGDVADRELVKQLWGQLPERLRQQLLQSSSDEFLPKYREQLELYFRRLAEETGDSTP